MTEVTSSWQPMSDPYERPALADFLLARIAELEAAVEDWPREGPWGMHPSGVMWQDGAGRPIYAPRARVLAECDAMRRAVEVWRREQAACGRWKTPTAQRWAGDDPRVAAEKHAQDGRWLVAYEMLGLLALPYADHPDYRGAWKP